MNYRLFILFRDGEMPQAEVVDAIVELVEKRGKIVDLGFGSAYNMPIYLLGELEGHEEEAIVVSMDWDDEMPHPRFLVEPSEIVPLMEALEANQDSDSWEIAVRVNRQIRGN